MRLVKLIRVRQLVGVSLLALIAAGVLAPNSARACEATAEFDEGSEVVAVDVDCNADSPVVSPFATSYIEAESETSYDGNGNDTIDVSGGTIAGDGDTPEVVNETPVTRLDPGSIALPVLTLFVETLGGNDRVLVDGFFLSDGSIVEGTVGSASLPVTIDLGGGDDRFELFDGGHVYGSVLGGAGTDTFHVAGGAVEFSLSGGEDEDFFDISGGTIGGSVFGDVGNDDFFITGGAIEAFNGEADFAGVNLDAGNDEFTMTGGTVVGGVAGAVDGGTGTDTIKILGGTLDGSIVGGADADTVTISGGTVVGGVAGAVDGGAGTDTINISGGTLDGSIVGGADADTVIVSGGTVAGDIGAEAVNVSGGAVKGDVSGLSVLDITETAPINLRDGITFSGIGAVGTITDTALAGVGSAGFPTQNFSGFSSLTLDDSTIGFRDAVQEIDQLALNNGSRLFIDGAVTLASREGGLGDLSASGSTVSLIDNEVNDTFSLGGVVFHNTTLGLDINQVTAEADTLVVEGPFTATGSNVILVNLVDTPNFLGTTRIPIVIGDGLDPSTFTVDGVSGTAASLFNYEIVEGSLILLATPSDLSPALATQVAADSQPVTTALDTIDSVLDDAAEFGLGLSSGGTQVQISETFGVFASGQFARVSHDGFTVSNGAFSAAGPAFDSNDFSAAISLDFNAAKHFEFDDQYGLNIGLFGGYTSSDVTLGAYQNFPFVGAADNASGMVGVYSLFRQGQNYLLVSGTTFIGETDIVNNVLASTGDYGTTGYAVTASAGHIFNLSDTLRFDLRGGILGVTFTGDDYTDSRGNHFGESQVSFGALKFEPGIYADRQLENGMVFSPYVRLDLQQRFGYENTANISGLEYEFDDSDFSASLSGGLNLKVSTSTTVSGEVRGKLSSDSSTLAGKIGLKMAF